MRYALAVPRKQKLKVYRIPAGFYDAYVAAPSQKAALDAWGSDRDLFSRGVAEQVTDEALIREPLDHPGTVIKKSRGTAAEQLAALPEPEHRRPLDATAPPKTASPTKPSSKASSRGAAEPVLEEPRAKPQPQSKPRPKAKPKPPPDRAPRDEARNALEAAEKQYQGQRAVLKQRADQLARDKAALDRAQNAELATLKRIYERAEAAYDRQMRAWRAEALKAERVRSPRV